VDPSNVLGTVEVEVKANLDKLTADFARGKVQTQAFANDLGKVTGAAKISAAQQLQLSQSYNALIKTYDPLRDKMNRYRADLEQIRKINAAPSGLFSPAELARLNAGVAAFARTNKDFATAMSSIQGPTANAELAVASLKKQYGSLVQQFNPLQIAQQKYTSDLSTLNLAQKAGLATDAEVVLLRGRMASSFADTTKKIEGETVGLEGWARSTEHHVRAMRLLISFIGVDMAARLGEFAIKTLESVAALKEQAAQLGLTTAELQEYKAIAGQVGMSSDDMVSAFATLGRNIDDLRLGRVGPFSKLLKQLGGDALVTAAKTQSTGKVFVELNDKLRDVGDQSQRQGANLIAFGEAGLKMGQLQERGSTGIDQLRAAVRQMGLILSDQQIQEADVTAKKLDLVGQALKIQFADTVVKNAQAITQLATALEHVAAIVLTRAIDGITTLTARIGDLASMLMSLQNIPDVGGSSVRHDIRGDIHTLSEGVGGYDFKTGRATGAVGKIAEAIGLQSGPQPSITVPLPAARPADSQPHGPNIKLNNLLSPKGKQAQQKYDEFAADMAKEKEQQLQLEREATGDLTRQNEIDHEIIDLKLSEQVESIKRQVHNKELTAKEGKQLIAEAQTTAAMEKEAADRKMRIDGIERQNQYANEIEQLMQDGLNIARAMARTDDDIKKADLAILDSKQRQVLSELQKEIAIAEEAPDEGRVAQLNDELVKLKESARRDQAVRCRAPHRHGQVQVRPAEDQRGLQTSH
jgi:hypothetical protein